MTAILRSRQTFFTGRDIGNWICQHNSHAYFQYHLAQLMMELCVDCLLNRLFRRRSKKASKLRVTGLAGNPLVTDGFPHKGPATRKMSPFDYIIMCKGIRKTIITSVRTLDMHAFKIRNVCFFYTRWNIANDYPHYNDLRWWKKDFELPRFSNVWVT